MVEMKLKPENTIVIFREGIEMYWAKRILEDERDPHVKPQSMVESVHWDKRHFEQEYGGEAQMGIIELPKKNYLQLYVECECCWTLHPPSYYGITKTNWFFSDDIPYIYIRFEENNKGMNPKGSEQWYKRYMASPPNIFTHYAKRLDDWALSNLQIIPNHQRYIHGDVYSRTPLDIQVEGDPPRHPCAKWLTLYNDKIGFAMVPPYIAKWSGDEYPTTSRCGLFHSWAMDELIYYCRQKDKTIHQMDMIYYAYHTTPEKQYQVLNETNYNQFAGI